MEATLFTKYYDVGTGHFRFENEVDCGSSNAHGLAWTSVGFPIASTACITHNASVWYGSLELYFPACPTFLFGVPRPNEENVDYYMT